MTRALITLVFAISLSAMTFCATVSSAIGRPAERHPLFVELASPRLATFAMTIL